MNKTVNNQIRLTVQHILAEQLTENFSCQYKANYELVLNESFMGTVRGVGAGLATAIIQMTGGALTFLSGATVTGTLIFASSILTASAVGNLVKNNYEMGALRKFDADLLGNITKRDELFKAYSNASAMGLTDPKQYQSKVSQLTKEQQKIGERMMKHLMSSQQTLEKSIPTSVIDKLFTLADLAKKGSLTNVEEVAKYRVQI